MAALRQDHPAADEAGHPCRAAVPDARRVPDLRQHLHPHRRSQQHRLGVDPHLPQPHHGAEPGHRLGAVDPDPHLRRDHRSGLYQGIRYRRSRNGCEALMATTTTTTRQKVGWGTANTIVVVLTLIPVLWIVSLSFKDPSSITDPTYFPVKWTWSNYSGILTTSSFIRPLINSIGIGLISTLIAVVLASMAAYAVARLSFPGKQVLIGMSLLIAMFPAVALATPMFNIERILGLFNTWPGLIIPYVATGLPLGIYTLSAFFREIPWELEKAAKIDGATPFQAFTRVIAPLAAPGMVTTAILVFLFCWNEFLLAITLTSTTAARTAPAAIGFFSGSSQFAVPTGSISAAAVVITIPIIVFVLFFQRRIVAGLTSGAVKG